MTDTEQPNGKQPSEDTSEAPPEIDAFLVYLMDNIEETKSSLDVTFFVGGALVCGTLITAEQYVEKFLAQLKGPNAEADKGTEPETEAIESEDQKKKPRHYCHLKDVTITQSGRSTITIHPSDACMRLKLSSIDGLIIGRMRSAD